MHRPYRYDFRTLSTGLFARLGFSGVFIALAFACGVCRPVAAQGAQAKPEAPKHMPADADPAYEVATIKPSNPDDHNSRFFYGGHHLTIENHTLNTMLLFAYGIHPRQIVDAPAWLGADHYDIDGVLDTEGEPSLKQLEGIVKKLLADRFQLKFHLETRELAVYALTVAKDGPRLTKSKGDPNALGNENDQEHGGQMTMTITDMSMSQFVLIMQMITDRPVVDQSGLAGKWDFKWTWTSDENRVPPDIPNPAPGMFTAIQEQLGLKLEAKRAPADAFVIDHVERPSAN